MILIVTYDLSPTFDHSIFFDALKQQGSWWHYLTSVWLIATTKTPEQVFQAVAPYMVQADRVLIFEVGKSYNGWLPKEAWDWIQQQQATGALQTLANLTPLPPPPGAPNYIAEFLKGQSEKK
jgi:hypothetical protein